MVAAFELVDWLRLVDHSLNPKEVGRLAAVISRFYKPALKEFSENLHPSHALFWQGLDVVSQFSDLRNQLRGVSLLSPE
jgi:nucleolar pre-ribosomal-associated protein 1